MSKRKAPWKPELVKVMHRLSVRHLVLAFALWHVIHSFVFLFARFLPDWRIFQGLKVVPGAWIEGAAEDFKAIVFTVFIVFVVMVWAALLRSRKAKRNPRVDEVTLVLPTFFLGGVVCLVFLGLWLWATSDLKNGHELRVVILLALTNCIALGLIILSEGKHVLRDLAEI
jgi:hypothetical protein